MPVELQLDEAFLVGGQQLVLLHLLEQPLLALDLEVHADGLELLQDLLRGLLLLDLAFAVLEHHVGQVEVGLQVEPAGDAALAALDGLESPSLQVHLQLDAVFVSVVEEVLHVAALHRQVHVEEVVLVVVGPFVYGQFFDGEHVGFELLEEPFRTLPLVVDFVD